MTIREAYEKNKDNIKAVEFFTKKKNYEHHHQDLGFEIMPGAFNPIEWGSWDKVECLGIRKENDTLDLLISELDALNYIGN